MQHGCILIAGTKISEHEAIEMAKAFTGLNNLDLAKEVTTTERYKWTEGVGHGPMATKKMRQKHLPFHVVVYDYGVKRNILRLLVDQGCHLTVVPATTSASEVLALKPDGLFLSEWSW